MIDKRLFALPVLLLCLTAGQCAHTEPGVEIREVPTPVPVACVSQERLAEAQAAEPPAISGTLNGDANHDLPIVTAIALDWKAYATDLMGIVRGCAEGVE